MRYRFCDRNPHRIQRSDLFYRSPLAAGNDGAGMPHALSWRCHAAGDEGSDRLLHIVMDPFRSLFLRRTTDLADHEDRLGIRVVIEKLQCIDEVRAFDRVAADADRTRLSDACMGQLEGRFVSQRAGTGNHAHVAFFIDLSGDDADIRFIDRNETRAVRSDEAGLFAHHVAVHLDHVFDRNMFRDADDELQARFDCFKDGIGCKGSRDENDRGRGFGDSDGISHGIEDRYAAADFTGSSRCRAAYDICAILLHLFGMETGCLARDALHNDFGIFMN